jgi:hypothetical protein
MDVLACMAGIKEAEDLPNNPATTFQLGHQFLFPKIWIHRSKQ